MAFLHYIENNNAKIMTDVNPAEYMAFIVGNEGAGIDDSLIATCDGGVVIEMASQVESLNVGVAGSILMCHFNGLK